MTNKILKIQDKIYKRVMLSKKNLTKLFKNPESKIEGFLVGANVNIYNYFSHCYFASSVHAENETEFHQIWNAFLFYLEPKLGKYAKFYIQIN